MKNNKIQKKISIFLIYGFLFFTNYIIVNAEATIYDDEIPYGNGVSINIPNFIGGEDTGNSDTGKDVYAISGYGTDGYFCRADDRIKNYCTEIATCNNDCNPPGQTINASWRTCDYKDDCNLSVAKIYDTKMKEILQAEIDAIINEKGLDLDKSNKAIESCGGDPVCIDKILAVIQKDPSYSTSGESDNSNTPLSSADISDYLSGKTEIPSKPIVYNGENNDPFNLNSQKEGPKVEVAFTKTSDSGVVSRMQATAVPGFFDNASDPKGLYFTWYLQRSGCEKNSSNLSKCDKDNNGKVDENDWKIEAAKIIAARDFDSSYANYSNEIDSTLSAYKAEPDFSNTENDEDTCFVQSAKTGTTYELRETESDFNESCPDGSQIACLAEKTQQCDVFNTKYVVGGTEPFSVKNDFSACTVLDPKKAANPHPICGLTNENLKNFKPTVTCSDGALPLCVKSLSSNVQVTKDVSGTLGEIVQDSDKAICSSIAKPDTVNGTTLNPLFLPNTDIKFPAENLKCSYLQGALINGIKDSAGSTIRTGDASLQPQCKFIKKESLCKHLFPKLPNSKMTINGREFNFDGEKIGDNRFIVAEKAFWGLDPTKSSTSGTGKDEMMLAGLGIDKFEWVYSPGDKVGVVVEGNSAFKSDHNENTSKRMWAFSKGKCDELEDLEDVSGNRNVDGRGYYWENSNIGILTAELDLNDCLAENLLDPNESNNTQSAISLVASPQNPTNDPNGRGDILTIASAPANFQNPEGLVYKWSVQKSKSGSAAITDSTSWLDITNSLIESGSIAAEDREGINKKDLNVNLNLTNIEAGMDPGSYSGVFYLKVKVKIIGTEADGSQSEEGYVVVRVKQQQNQIVAYPVTATDDGMVTINKGLSDQSLEICPNLNERCYVSKNTIIGLEIPDTANSILSGVTWKVNGNDMQCKTSYSAGCSSGNMLFLPVLGNEGEAINVVATAINSQNESIELSRYFIIGKDDLMINVLEANASCSLQCLSTSNICPRYLGHYNNINGFKVPDCSYKVWEAKKGSMITLATTGQNGFEWTLDGMAIPEFKDKNQIQFKLDKPVGSLYTVGLIKRNLPDNNRQMSNMRLALNKNWGVSPEESVENSNDSVSMQINIAMEDSNAVALEKQGFAASLITHLSEQMMFLMKITLTSILLFSLMSLLFAVMPNSYNEV